MTNPVVAELRRMARVLKRRGDKVAEAANSSHELFDHGIARGYESVVDMLRNRARELQNKRKK